VSERPWTGVTGPRGTNSSENYISYGYLVYDMDRESGQMLSQPVLLKGMSIREWEGGNAATPR
jgi:GDP-D-mannose dehydratase